MLTQFLLWLKTLVIADEKGQTLAEYALILALIVIVVIVVLGPLGTAIAAIYPRITTALGIP